MEKKEPPSDPVTVPESDDWDMTDIDEANRIGETFWNLFRDGLLPPGERGKPKLLN
jgi:hypothetical protein